MNITYRVTKVELSDIGSAHHMISVDVLTPRGNRNVIDFNVSFDNATDADIAAWAEVLFLCQELPA